MQECEIEDLSQEKRFFLYCYHSLKNENSKINPINSSDLYQFSNNYDKIDCLKITYIYLEKLLRFIEKEYRNYLNENIQIPYRSTLVKEFEITNKLKEVKSRLLESNINDQLLKMAYEPLLKITTISAYKSMNSGICNLFLFLFFVT
nr:hypothetical protein [uncultured Flavobacterium sp.]